MGSQSRSGRSDIKRGPKMVPSEHVTLLFVFYSGFVYTRLGCYGIKRRVQVGFLQLFFLIQKELYVNYRKDKELKCEMCWTVPFEIKC
jgi:hypothetical protein